MWPRIVRGAKRATGLSMLFAVLAVPTTASAIDGQADFGGLDAANLVEAAAAAPPGFEETIAFSGLTAPMSIDFAPDGRIFIAEKSGLVKVFDGLTDTTPTIYADLRTQVHDFWDR